MATLRKFVAYRNWDRPYTRKSKFKTKAFIKAVPAHKIAKFIFGNGAKTDWKYKISVKTKDKIQIRHNALESSRQVINRDLQKVLGLQNYFFRINVYPHQVLRENKLGAGAGADRLSTGMKHSFGKAISVAARLKAGDTIFTTFVASDAASKLAHQSLKKAAARLPCKILIEKEEI